MRDKWKEFTRSQLDCLSQKHERHREEKRADGRAEARAGAHRGIDPRLKRGHASVQTGITRSGTSNARRRDSNLLPDII